jgi:hypothetical protein
MGVPNFDVRPVIWGMLIVGMGVGILAWKLLGWLFSHVSIGWIS